MYHNPDEKISVSEIIDAIEAELERTRLRPKSMDAALRKLMGSSYSVDYITAAVSGKADCIPLLVWERVIDTVKKLPNAPSTTGSDAIVWKKDDYIPLSDEMRAELSAELSRTDIGCDALARMCPSALRPHCHKKIYSWVDGRISRVHQEAWAAVLSIVKAIPDKAPSSPKKQAMKRLDGLFPLRQQDIDAIKHHRQRTGVPYEAAIETIKGCPPGLDRDMVGAWVSSRGTQSANPEFVALVVCAYEALKDR